MDEQTIAEVNRIAKETLNQNTILNKTEFDNTYEFGSAGNRFKLYFKDAVDLLNKVKELREKGFAVEIAAGI